MTRLDEMLRFHTEALRVRGYRQQLLAGNIANADVPGFKARDIDFTRVLETALARPEAGKGTPQRSAPAVTAEPLYRIPRQPNLDGNTVEMDVERAQFADNAVHMEASLTFLSSQIKAMLAAIQGS